MRNTFKLSIAIFILFFSSLPEAHSQDRSLIGKWEMYKNRSPAGWSRWGNNPYIFITLDSLGNYKKEHHYNLIWKKESLFVITGEYKITSDSIQFYQLMGTKEEFGTKPFEKDSYSVKYEWIDEQSFILYEDFQKKKKTIKGKWKEYYRKSIR